MSDAPYVNDLTDLEMVGASVFIAELHGFPNAFERLQTETQWAQKQRVSYGKVVAEPRLTAWYGDEGCSYSYSGMKNEPLPWTPLLSEMRVMLKELLGCDFNSVLLNFYRDGNDSIGFHSDDEKELGKQPTIVSISFGGSRKFEFKRKDGSAKLAFELTDHSLLLMMGDTQKNWLHGIQKCRKAEPRINLTFRQIRI